MAAGKGREVQMTFGFQFRESRSAGHRISDAPISTIHGFMQLESELRDREGDAGHQDRRRDLFLCSGSLQTSQISQNGTNNEKNGNWRPTIAPAEGIDASDAREACYRCADGVIGDRSSIGDQRQPGSRKGRETKSDQNCTCDGDRRTKTRGPFEEGAECDAISNNAIGGLHSRRQW